MRAETVTKGLRLATAPCGETPRVNPNLFAAFYCGAEGAVGRDRYATLLFRFALGSVQLTSLRKRIGFSEFASMTRSGPALAIALVGLAAFASPVDAKTKHRPASAYPAPAARSNFPVYVSRGVDRNPGGDNLYFQDTKRPSYIVGPGYLGYINNNTTFGPNY